TMATDYTFDPLHQDENGEYEEEYEYEDGDENEYQEERNSGFGIEDTLLSEDEDEEETLIPHRNQIVRRMQLQKSLPANRTDSPQTSDAACYGESFGAQDIPYDVELEVPDSYLSAGPIPPSSQATVKPIVGVAPGSSREKRRSPKLLLLPR
ncbi:hypothetical protein BX616_001069, partial [Lobosporangium transversale]